MGRILGNHEKLRCWVERGFHDFIDGTFGNAGHNIYVSKAGILQRIRHFDINSDGYVDLPICNSQNDSAVVPAYVYHFPLSESPVLKELPTIGAYAGALADLNGDGYDDLVIAMQFDGATNDLCAHIYYGAPEGMSERYKIQLPAPNSIDVAIGDFNGDGLLDIAFAQADKLRIFYQEEGGFAQNGFVDIEITLTDVNACDLDNDGYCDLYVRDKDGKLFILWGGPEGLNVKRKTSIDLPSITPDKIERDIAASSSVGFAVAFTGARKWKPKVITLNGKEYLFVARGEESSLIKVYPDRTYAISMNFMSGPIISAAAGDLRGTGYDDLVFVSRQRSDKREISWVYWNQNGTFHDERRTSFYTSFASDIAIHDLDGDGCEEIVICQSRTVETFTNDCFIYTVSSDGLISPVPIKLNAHDAQDVLIGRTCDENSPQVIFINRAANRTRADVPIYIYWNSAKGFEPSRRTELPGWACAGIITCDFFDRGFVDSLLVNTSENTLDYSPGSFLYLGDEDGFNIERKIVFPSTHPIGVACADINRDGYLDLMVCGFNNPDILIFYGSKDGFDLEHPEVIRMEINGRIYKEPRYIALADMNNDGWLDLIIPQILHEHLMILWGGPSGYSMERCTLLKAPRSVAVRAADLTGNGWPDLIVGGFLSYDKQRLYNGDLHIYWNGPEGLREDRKAQLPIYAACGDINVADFNNDGILDIFVGCYHAGNFRDIDSFIFWGEPGGHYSTNRRTRLYNHSAAGSLAADFNEDGWVDIAVSSHRTYGNHVGLSKIWINGPQGFSRERVIKLPSMGPHGMTNMDIGNLLDRGLEEYYISSPYHLLDDACVVGISWEAKVPIKTWVRAQLRFAKTKENLEKAEWIGRGGPGTWFENGQELSRTLQKGGWVQYRLALGAINGGNTPRVSEVRVLYFEI